MRARRSAAIPLSRIKFAELIGALSYALDLTEGQPPGHCMRCCWIGTHIGQRLGLEGESLWELYYTLLLKDLGCSSNAARICELYLTDDRQFKHDFKEVDGSVSKSCASCSDIPGSAHRSGRASARSTASSPTATGSPGN